MDYHFYNSTCDYHTQGGGDYPQKIAFFEQNLERLHNNHGEDLKILDIACNDGKMSKRFKKYGQVAGVDINKKAIQLAKKRGIDAVYGDALQIDKLFPLNAFDVVVAGDIIEHIFDTDLFLKKIYKVLKKGGTLLLSTPNLLSVGRRFMALTGKNPFCEYSAKHDGINVGHIRYYTMDNLYSQLKENDYIDIKIDTDTTNIPIQLIDSFLLKINPKLGRELLALAKKE